PPAPPPPRPPAPGPPRSSSRAIPPPRRPPRAGGSSPSPGWPTARNGPAGPAARGPSSCTASRCAPSTPSWWARGGAPAATASWTSNPATPSLPTTSGSWPTSNFRSDPSGFPSGPGRPEGQQPGAGTTAMPGHDYRFTTRWRVTSTPEEVYRILEDTPGLARWWPAVWLRVEALEPGDAR